MRLFRTLSKKHFSTLAIGIFAGGFFSKVSSDRETLPERQPITQNNWVTARVWQARDANCNLTTPEAVMTGKGTQENKESDQRCQPRVGHASVETENLYSSFWPAEEASKRNGGIKTPVSGTNNDLLRTDINSEGGEATTEVTFYSLNKSAIGREFRQMRSENKNYVMKPSPLLTVYYNQKNSDNCTTAAYRLLKAGGINELSKEKCAPLANKYIAMSPNELQECIRTAKENELKQHPETASFNPPSRRI